MLTSVGVNETAAAVVLSQACTLAVFVLLWQMVRGVRHRRVVMLTAAVFPGIIYFFNVFPISLLVLLTLVLFKLLAERRYRWAVVPAFLVPLTYSSAVAVIGVLALWLLLRRLRDWRGIGLALAASAAGYLVFLAVLQITVGSWKAEFWIQEKYGNGLHDPLKTLFSTTAPAPGRFFAASDIVALQAQLVLLVVVLLTYVVYDNRAKLTSLDQLVACWTAVFWVSRSWSGSPSTRTAATRCSCPRSCCSAT